MRFWLFLADIGPRPSAFPLEPSKAKGGDSNFNPILSWVCLRAVYQMQMQRLCDEAAEAA